MPFLEPILYTSASLGTPRGASVRVAFISLTSVRQRLTLSQELAGARPVPIFSRWRMATTMTAIALFCRPLWLAPP